MKYIYFLVDIVLDILELFENLIKYIVLFVAQIIKINIVMYILVFKKILKCLKKQLIEFVKTFKYHFRNKEIKQHWRGWFKCIA